MRARSAFSARLPVLTVSEGPGAKQSFKNECDINKIMARFIKTGTIDHVARFGGSYGFADSMTYHEAQNIVANANSMFAELPAAIRKEFDDKPEVFLDFVYDPKNADRLREMGLAKAKVEPPKPEPAPEPVIHSRKKIVTVEPEPEPDPGPA